MTGREGTPAGVDDQRSGDDALLGSVARQLRVINRSAGWARTTAVGEAVINSFFDGDCESFRSSPRRAEQSLRRIAAHPACPLKKSALANAVHVYAFVVEHPQVREWEHVLPGHVATVLKCRADERLNLLQQVQVERPTMKAFALHVAMHGNAPTKAPALPAARAAATALTVLRSAEMALAGLAELLAQPTSWVDSTIECARSIVARLEARLAQARAHVSVIQSSAKPCRLDT